MTHSNIKSAPDGLPAMLSLSYGDFGYSIGYIPQEQTGGGIRGDCRGWSDQNVSGLSNFTNSVVADALSGFGFAITLTFQKCPATAKAMHKCRRAFIKRLERRGLIRLLWICEFQRRCVPHFHMAAYFKTDKDKFTGLPLENMITQLWCEVAEEYGVKDSAQTCKNISDVGGWFGYLQKHIDRGIYHYQRQRDTLPPEWKEKTGRVWSWVGDWKRDLTRLHFSGKEFSVLFRFRDCEQKKRIAYYRTELARYSGSHFSFIGHNRHFIMNGIKYRYSKVWVRHYIINRLEVVGEKYAAIGAERGVVSMRQIPKARRSKKRVFSRAKKKNLLLSLPDASASQKQAFIKRKTQAFSACRGTRGAGKHSRVFVKQVQSYERGYVSRPVRIQLALDRSLSMETKQ